MATQTQRGGIALLALPQWAWIDPPESFVERGKGVLPLVSWDDYPTRVAAVASFEGGRGPSGRTGDTSTRTMPVALLDDLTV